jgi:SET family sugar efflux transporter-like MFS transporter
MTRNLNYSNGDVGLVFSVCAAVEVVSALGLMALADRVSNIVVIQVGILLLGLQFALLLGSSSWALLLLSQVARGIGITAVGAAGIAWFQQAMPGMTGRATTLFANAGMVGSLGAGVIAGVTAQVLGYRTALLVFGVFCLIAWILLVVSLRRQTAGQDHVVRGNEYGR